MTERLKDIKGGTCIAIGSMPHKDMDKAIDLILEACPEAPCWPQLPALGFQENMMAQFAEGLPCVVIDKEAKKIYFKDPQHQLDEVTRFYEDYLSAEATGSLDGFALSPLFAQGLYAFSRRLSKEVPSRYTILKGQITGPLTLALSVTDEQGKSAFFNDTLADVIQKGIVMKARWQIRYLKHLCNHVIIFVDEPILAAFGSAAFINLSRKDVISRLGEIFSTLKGTGAIVGSHCCGNTDWSLLMEAGVDIINFDAYTYMETISLYPESLTTFLNKGGFLAWGIVPSAHLNRRPEVSELLSRLLRGLDLLQGVGIPRHLLLERILLTPSCGLGTLKDEEAERALRELATLSHRVRELISAS
jgi:methionine synthase II (cobalamin-independent)